MKTKIHLAGQRLLLRNLLPHDLPDFLDYRQDPEVCRYQGFDIFTKKEAIDFIKKQQSVIIGIPGQWSQIAIIKKEDQRLIGDCAVKFQAAEPRIAELGYTINPRFQRQGYATETLQTLLQHIFEERNIHRVLAVIDIRNQSSIKLAEKLGFVKEAHYRQSYFDELDKTWTDEYLYALLQSDFKR
jgi:Acetyltransferases, including N-acetylases of ribosomal proteins